MARLWMRLGAEIELDDVTIERIKSCDVNTAALVEGALKDGRVRITGDCYIPGDLLGDGQEDHGFDMNEVAVTVATPQNVQVYLVREPMGKLRAYARVILGQLQLTGLRIYEGTQGLFVSYPNDPASKGEDYRQIFYPITRELRDSIEKAVLAEYEYMMARDEEEKRIAVIKEFVLEAMPELSTEEAVNLIKKWEARNA